MLRVPYNWTLRHLCNQKEQGNVELSCIICNTKYVETVVKNDNIIQISPFDSGLRDVVNAKKLLHVRMSTWLLLLRTYI